MHKHGDIWDLRVIIVLVFGDVCCQTLIVGLVIPIFVPISVFIFFMAAISSSMRCLAFLSSSISFERLKTKAREADDLFDGVPDLRESCD